MSSKIKIFVKNNFFWFFLALFPLISLPGQVSPQLGDVFGKLFFLISAISILAFIKLFPGKQKIQNEKTLVFIWPLLIFLLVLILASFFGPHPIRSFWGSSAKPFLPLSAWLALFGVYYFTARSRERKKFILAAYIPFIVIVALLVFEYFSVWLGFFENSEALNFLRRITGSYEDVSLFLSLLAVPLAGFLFLGRNLDFTGSWRRLLLVFWLGAVFILANINYLPAWWCFSLGAAALLFFERKYFSGGKNKIILATAVFGIAFLLLNYFATGQSSVLSRREAMNFRLDLGSSLLIAKNSFFQNLFFGRGPESLPQSLALHRPQDINHDYSWNIRFSSTSSFWINLFLVSGLIGCTAFAYALFHIFLFSKEVLRQKAEPDQFFIPVLVFMIVFFCSLFFYSGSLLVLFLFFAALGFFESLAADVLFPRRKFSLSGVKIGFFRSSAFFEGARIVGLVLLILIFVFNLKIFFSEMLFRRSFFVSEADRVKYLSAAAQLNDSEAHYQEVLAKIYRAKALSLKSAGADNRSFQEAINQAIVLAKGAISAEPDSVSAKETLAVIYRDLADDSPESLDLALAYFGEAAALEPKNPVILVETAKLYSRKNDFAKAESSFLRAIELKPDYYVAKFELAKTYGAENKFEDALKILADIENNFNKTELYYEWGKIEFNRGRLGEARKRFEAVIAIEPAHANALFGLALTSEKEGKIQMAIEFLRKVEELNPLNIEIKNKIQKLGG